MRISASEQKITSGGVELTLQGSSTKAPFIKCSIRKHFNTTREAREWHHKKKDIVVKVLTNLEIICSKP